MEDFGLTKHEVYKDNYGATDEFINQKTGDLQSVVIAKTITAFTDYLIGRVPVSSNYGDRLEALAGTNYIKVLHVEGGEVSGNIDEIFRHAISKFSNFHCVSSKRLKTV